MYHDGEGGDVDLPRARQYFGMAAEQQDPLALCMLATMHREGEGGPVNPTEARRLYRLSLEQGDLEVGVKYFICFPYIFSFLISYFHTGSESPRQDVS